MLSETTIVKYDTWIWQIGKILRLRKEKCHNWLGWYQWTMHTDGTIVDSITYINIKPFWGAHLLKHEQGHQFVTRRCTNAEGAMAANLWWDSYSWHGFLFWRKPTD